MHNYMHYPSHYPMDGHDNTSEFKVRFVSYLKCYNFHVIVSPVAPDCPAACKTTTMYE